MSQLKRKLKALYKKEGGLAYHYYCYGIHWGKATDYEVYFAEKLGKYCFKKRS